MNWFIKLQILYHYSLYISLFPLKILWPIHVTTGEFCIFYSIVSYHRNKHTDLFVDENVTLWSNTNHDSGNILTYFSLYTYMGYTLKVNRLFHVCGVIFDTLTLKWHILFYFHHSFRILSIWTMCVCMCVCVWTYMTWHAIRGQRTTMGVSSLLPLCGFWGSKSGIRLGSKHPMSWVIYVWLRSNMFRSYEFYTYWIG